MWAFSSLIWPMSLFIPYLWGWLVLLLHHCIVPTMISFTFVFLLLLLGLRVEVPAMLVSYIIHSFRLYCKHSYWASSYNISGFPGPFHSLGILGLFHYLGILGPFHSFLLLTFPWAFAKSFGLPWSNYHIFAFGFIGLQTNLIY